MKNINNDRLKDIICNILFIITYLLIICIITRGGKYILGSTMDFELQHYIIPDYLRTLFYKTFDFLPDFAFNLGGGQNIYYFSYYGLLNPLVIVSYLVPFIKMLDYITILMSIVVVGSTTMFYSYLRKNNYSHLVSFISAILLLCSSPFIFQSHRHIMFIDYMPFLILGFFGIDKFIEKGKSNLLIISIVLIIFTSYYYSIASIGVLGLLAIYKYLKNKNFNFKELFFFLCKLVSRMLIAVMIGAVIIIPTFYTLLNGRSGSGGGLDLISLFKPSLFMLYGNYTMGLTAVSLIGTIYMLFSKKKENIFLSIIILLISIFPIFNFILNGMLYVNAKVLIPFIPLVLLNISTFLTIVFKNIKFKKIVASYLVLSALVICILINLTDNLMLKERYDSKINNNYNQIVENVLNHDDNIYRSNTSLIDRAFINRVGSVNEYKSTMYSSTFNKNYKDAYTKVFNNPLPYRNKFMLASSDNILFQMFMGEKYLFTQKNYESILEKVGEVESINIYKNNYVLPIGYATDKVINEEDFNRLEYPNNIINMLGKVVLNENTNTEIKSIKKLSKLEYKVVDSDNIYYEKTDSGYFIETKNRGRIKLKLDESTDNKILFISFDNLKNVSCSKGDLAITINGIKNKLTCSTWRYYNDNKRFNYAIILDSSKEMDIEFEKGKYNIGNINLSILDFNSIRNISKSVDTFMFDKEKTLGDNIVGSINARNDSYFTLSIPYDKGFEILVDNKKVDYYKVNTSFIGFDIKKGYHKIEISYHAPFKIMSCLISLVGIVLFTLICVYESRRKNGFNHSNSSLL